MIPIYHGFDGLEFSINVAIPEQLSLKLSEAQNRAREADELTHVDFGDEWLTVHQTGMKGGYAFRCTHAKTGEWFFKRPLERAPWGVRFSSSSKALAMHGLEGVRQMCKALLESLGVDAPDSAYRPSRIDFAVDFVAPDFHPVPELFVVHSNTSRRTIAEIEYIDVHSKFTHNTSVTVGKMPGRQIIIYNKSQEVLTKRKIEWFKIWEKSMAQRGLELELGNVWRVELRVAKDHLKDVWNVRSWAALYDQLDEILQKLLSDVRYCTPSSDANRARWESHEMWRHVKEAVESDLFDHIPTLAPQEYIEIKREQKIEELSRQSLGLLISIAAIKGIGSNTFPEYLHGMANRLFLDTKNSKQPLDEKLKKVALRYRDLV